MITMWRRLKGRTAGAPLPPPRERGEANLLPKPSVNQEYLEAFRTRSYIEIWSKVQCQIRHPRDEPTSLASSSSSSFSLPPPSSPSLYNHLPESLLEPRQETIDSILQQQISPSNSELRDLVHDYFDNSTEAGRTCAILLQCINQARINYRKIQKVLSLTQNPQDFTNEELNLVMGELSSFSKLDNPLSLSPPTQFQTIHDLYSLMQKKLTKRKRKITKRVKVIGLVKKLSSAGLILACTAFAVVGVFLAMHGCAGVLAAPLALPGFCTKMVMKLKRLRAFRTNSLNILSAQLDAAARGAYILIRDFDTMSRLVTRLHDEIEHNRAVITICLRNRERHMLQEILRELRLSGGGFVEQLNELEEHVYLCFLTINKARRLVIEEITAQKRQ
ncbi:UPF0496 protein At1g20180-like isoform X2 [Nymphaea colorata]|uniref:UPF0496 protein At1g20180-like isoform X2 n=1 Tax=Nymphaea colorata TaxID=210225 RepID=UPI00129D8471|nr:UPF0496 protein At1g20180-like isoform X2 [Nymphaea colorata]